MQLEDKRFVAIAVALPVPRVYHYEVPRELLDTLDVGHGVLVPFGPRKVSGFVLERVARVDVAPARLKPIERLLSPEPVFNPALLPFFKWVSDYYLHPLGEVIRTALPAGMLVESRLTCSLTPAGQTHLEQLTDRTTPEAVLLEYLHARGTLPWVRLLERPPIPGVTMQVNRLVEAGLIALAQALEDARVKPRYVEIYRPGIPVSTRDLKGAVQQTVVELLNEMGEATAAELREALASRGRTVGSLPNVLRRLVELELAEVESREVWREGGEAFQLTDTLHRLTTGQSRAVASLEEARERGGFHAAVLHGVTGSGKTEVYLQTVAGTLAKGRSAIVLVPEIALTPQLVGRFRARFGDGIACLHSGLSQGERFDAWRRLQRGDARVAIGARSAIFAPVSDLGLIIVDEEHDPSFKQDTGLRYNARDLAVVRAKQAAGIVLIGSATPALETIANTRRNRFSLLELPERVEDRPMPDVEIVDMTRPESRPRLEDSGLSPLLEDRLRDTVAAGRQAILLLNRRGFAPFVLCSSCGGSFRCLHCDISLTFHRRRQMLLCHYCGLGRVLPRLCPHCGDAGLSLMGMGTERLEQLLEAQLPGVAIGRLDRDAITSKEAYARILDAFRKEELQVLVGTQMVVKGHDFPNVTLVGIIQADYALNLPDFRASERTFQLVTQVAGRAGRGVEPGRVIVQTYTPKHPSILTAARHDYEGFYRHEMRIRRAHGYPPYSRLALLHVSARQETLAEGQAQKLTRVLRRLAPGLEDAGVEVLGPAPAPLSRLQQWYRWQVLLKAPGVAPLHQLLRHVDAQSELHSPSPEIRISIDMDPQNLL